MTMVGGAAMVGAAVLVGAAARVGTGAIEFGGWLDEQPETRTNPPIAITTGIHLRSLSERRLEPLVAERRLRFIVSMTPREDELTDQFHYNTFSRGDYRSSGPVPGLRPGCAAAGSTTAAPSDRSAISKATMWTRLGMALLSAALLLSQGALTRVFSLTQFDAG